MPVRYNHDNGRIHEQRNELTNTLKSIPTSVLQTSSPHFGPRSIP